MMNHNRNAEARKGWPWEDPEPEPPLSDMTAWPRITVVTPTYNQGRYIEKTIRSVLNQNYPNLEYIIIDGGSSDQTIDIVKRYEGKLAHWVSEPDEGQSNAINKGLALSTGELLTWLNSDDYYLPGAVGKVVEAYRESSDCGAIVGLGRTVDESGNIVSEAAPIEKVTLESLFCWLDNRNFRQPASFFTRKAWESVGPFDEGMHIAFDLEYWLRIKKGGFGFAVVNEYLAEELFHGDAKTTKYHNLMVADVLYAIARHGGHEYIRPRLERIARRLDEHEATIREMRRNPVLRATRRLRRLMGLAKRHERVPVPEWQKNS